MESNSGIIEFAKLFKERDNKDFLGVQIGTVVEPLPEIQISILGGKVLLNKKKLIWTSSIFDLHKLLNPLEDENQALKVGNEVVLIPSKDGQMFFVVDKVVRK
ncbi:DUF2577 family protein [Brevibacillus agri]|uniref:DUF2577 family protein n=1 Tax=Brevibacillus agri TaxID=51101 RepID=UPI0025B6875E|nr:DUF2577 family protein [Brevibacillus agri]MDN4093580.1 DUF2577 family protein [Brevibacillus agri]